MTIFCKTDSAIKLISSSSVSCSSVRSRSFGCSSVSSRSRFLHFAPPQATNAIAKPHTINIANTFFIVYRFIKLAANILGMSIFRPLTFEKIDDFAKWRFAFDY